MTVADVSADAQAGLPDRVPVEIDSGGVTLVGHLHLPRGSVPASGHPALVVAGPWTQVEQQSAHAYATRLAERGYAALSVDFRHWGRSGGEPRYVESPEKVDDLLAGVGFLQQRPEVDGGRIGAYGVCFGAGYALAAAARDGRVRAVVTTAAWLHDLPSLVAMFGQEEIDRRLRAAEQARRAWEQDRTLVTVPAWSDSDPEAGMTFPGGYYSTAERGAIPEWANQLAVLSWTDWIGFDAVALAPQVHAPTLFVHSDGSALPDNVRRAHATLGGPAHLFWTVGGHFDFYDREPQLGLAVDVAAAFLRTVL